MGNALKEINKIKEAITNIKILNNIADSIELHFQLEDMDIVVTPKKKVIKYEVK